VYFVDCKTTIKNNGLHTRCDDASLPAAAKSWVENVAKVRSMSFDGDPRVGIDE
jgi:lipoate synthase